MINDEILKSFQSRSILVTGGTGLIGRQVVEILCSAGAHVKTVSLDHLKINERAEHVFGDLRYFDFCQKITKGMDFVFHLAGVQGSVVVSRTQPASHFVPTLMINTNALEACRLNKVRKIVYTSSIGAYAQSEVFRETDIRYDTHPMDFAGWAKRMAELQIQAYHKQYGLLDYSIVVPAHVYGPGDNFDPDTAMVIPSLLFKIANGDDPVLVWGDGSAVRDFVYSKDVAEGIILALYHGTKAGIVNLGGGRGVSIKELVQTLRGFLDFNYRFDTSKPAGAPRRVMDISLARKLLGYNPTTSLLDGLKKTWEWYSQNPREHLCKINYHKEDAR